MKLIWTAVVHVVSHFLQVRFFHSFDSFDGLSGNSHRPMAGKRYTPQTLGGCMGDGQHVWAAAEWVLMIRNCFVREESGKLIFCSGILPEWYGEGDEIAFGKTRTSYGFVSIRLCQEGSEMRVRWEADWPDSPPQIEVRLPGHQPVIVPGRETTAVLRRGKNS